MIYIKFDGIPNKAMYINLEYVDFFMIEDMKKMFVKIPPELLDDKILYTNDWYYVRDNSGSDDDKFITCMWHMLRKKDYITSCELGQLVHIDSMTVMT